jgi:hypothetical protein
MDHLGTASSDTIRAISREWIGLPADGSGGAAKVGAGIFAKPIAEYPASPNLPTEWGTLCCKKKAPRRPQQETSLSGALAA